MGVSTAIGIGGALLGGLAGSKKSGGGTTTSTSAPWSEQQPYLTYGFGQAKDALGNALANPVYTGPRVAGLSPFQAGGADWLANYTATRGFGTSNLINDASTGMIGTGANFGNNAGTIFNRASMDPTQQIIQNAGQFANNPFVDGMIDSASRDISRNLFESTLPGIDRAASGSGNLNSTRAGVETAIARRGAADRLADMSSDIRGKFFGQGLSMAQNQYNQNLQNMLSANSGLLNAFNSGIAGANTGQNLAAGNFDALNAAGGLYQGQAQREIDADMAQFNESNTLPLSLISQYMSSIGGNYGGTQTSTAPSVGGGFGGMVTGALGGGLGTLGTLGKLKGTGIFGL